MRKELVGGGMTQQEISQLKHNVFNPLAVIVGRTEILKVTGKISTEEAKVLEDMVHRIESYIRSIPIKD